jgi:AcrR family transcriptional regulator
MTTRTKQKERTRIALVEAARELLLEGQAPTVAASADRAMISEATAYRYYTSARSLLQDVLVINWPGLENVLADLRALPTVRARAQLAAEAMARTVLANEAQVRALISLSYSSGKSDEIHSAGDLRPAFRVALIDAVLDRVPARVDKKRRRQFRLALSVTISAEAVLSLKDLGGYDDQEIISTLGRSAYHLTTAELDRSMN